MKLPAIYTGPAGSVNVLPRMLIFVIRLPFGMLSLHRVLSSVIAMIVIL
jgi:hypothetical protein